MPRICWPELGTNPGRTVSNRPEDRVGRMGTTASCKTCGTELRAGARFCDACGSPIAPSHELAEFKQVTVLFADVVHSMGIASAVSADEVPGRLSDHLHPHRGAKRHLMTAARRTHPVAPPQIPGPPRRSGRRLAATQTRHHPAQRPRSPAHRENPTLDKGSVMRSAGW